MTTTVAQLADTLQTLFTTTAQQLATDTGLIRRRRKLSGPSFAQGLVFTWLDNPHATREDLALAVAPDGAAAAARGVAAPGRSGLLRPGRAANLGPARGLLRQPPAAQDDPL